MEKELKDFESKLQVVLGKLKEDFSTLRTNRPTTKLIEDIKVDYYGQMMPLKTLGSIGINPPREINVSPWDKNALGPISKALEGANLGMSPTVDGNIIRLNLPPLTQERKLEMVKFVKKVAEEIRIKIRLERDEVNKRIKEAEEKKQIGEGEKFKFKSKVQEIVDKSNEEIEKMVEVKIKEIQE